MSEIWIDRQDLDRGNMAASLAMDDLVFNHIMPRHCHFCDVMFDEILKLRPPFILVRKDSGERWHIDGYSFRRPEVVHCGRLP